MTFWISIYFSILFFSFYIYKKITLKIIWIFLGILSAFRYNVGTDYHSYKDMYIAFQLSDVPRVWELKEPFFTGLIKILTFSNLNFQSLFIVTSVIIVVLFYLSSTKLYQNKDEQYLFLFLFIPILYLTSLNVMRQFIAISIFSYSIYYLIINKTYKYILGIAIAFLFHYSAIILLPISMFYKIRLNKLSIVIIIVMIFSLLYINAIYIIQDILSFFQIRYAYYLNNVIELKSPLTMMMFFVKLFVSLFLIFLLDRKNDFNNILFNTVLYFLLLSSAVYYSNVGSRLVFYFNFIYILLIVQIYKQYKLKYELNSKKLIFISILSLSILYLMYSSYFREVKDEAYSHYTLNFDILNEGYPMEVYNAKK